MTISGEFLNYVLEQLSALRGVTSRRMFGAVGLYCEGVIFGLIASDVLYFKVGDGGIALTTNRVVCGHSVLLRINQGSA